MKEQTPISTPLSKRWREFRIQVVPALVFAGSVVAAVYLWSISVVAPVMQAVAEAPRAQVTSPQPGRLIQLNVAQYQKVSQGEPVAVLLPADPRAPLDLMQSELNLLRTRLDPRMTEQRNATDLQRLRLEILLQKVALATAKVTLRRAESDFARNARLLGEKLVSQDLYELSERDRDVAKIDVEEKTRLIAELEENFNSLGNMGGPVPGSPLEDSRAATLKAQEEKLKTIEAMLGPVTLVAPIDGVISSVLRQAGENVVDGEPILIISSPDTTRLMGYLRQPLPLDLKPGQAVEVHTRSVRRGAALATVLNVGPQMEPITNSLAMIRPGSLVDMGLPVEVSLPPGLNLRPGEIVDLSLPQR